MQSTPLHREEEPHLSDTNREVNAMNDCQVILLPAAESFKKGSCQLQAKVCAGSTG